MAAMRLVARLAAQSVLFAALRTATAAHARTTLLTNEVRRSASTSNSATRGAATAPRIPRGGKLELEPSDLYSFIATGKMAPSALQTSEGIATADPEPDPYEVQTAHILVDLNNYSQRLKAAGVLAEEKYNKTEAQEALLEQNFYPTQLALEEMIKTAANEAAKAEATAMLERLTKIHNDQVSILDRSARFWEEHIAKEKELTRVAEAKTRLEESALNAMPMQKYVEAQQMKAIADEEKIRLEQWLQGFNTQLTAEEQALVQQARDYNMTDAYPPDLLKLRGSVTQKAAKAAGQSIKEVFPCCP